MAKSELTPRVEGLNHINIRLPRAELRRLRDFYCDVLGFVDGPRPPFRFPGYWLYAGDEAVLHLVEIPAAESSRPGDPGTVIDHVAFTCQGYDAVIERLDAHELEYQLDEVPATQLRQIFVHDPAGIRVELNFSGG